MNLLDLYIEALEIQNRHQQNEMETIAHLPVGDRVTRGYAIRNASVSIYFYPTPPNYRCSTPPEGMGYIQKVNVHCGNNLSKFRVGSSVQLSHGDHSFRMEVVQDSGMDFILQPNPWEVENCLMEIQDYPTFNWNVDYIETDITYKMLMATAHWMELSEMQSTTTRVEDILLGKASIASSDNEVPPFPDLNDSQNTAVSQALGCRNFCLIQGPPGTGKTYTIGRIGALLIEKGYKVIVSGPTHTAINHCLNTIAEEVNDCGKVVKVGEHYQADELADEHKISRRKRLSKDQYNSDRILNQQGIAIGATPYTLCEPATTRMAGWEFDYAIVDEAAQLSIPMAIVLMMRCRRIIWVGDPEQLCPIQPANTGNWILEKSIFQHLALLYPSRVTLLSCSYRLCEELLSIPNQLFYGNKLHSKVPQIKPYTDFYYHTHHQGPLKAPAAGILMLHDEFDGMGHSPYEAYIISEWVSELLNNGIPLNHIGILTPYRAQVREIKRTLWEQGIVNENLMDQLFVDTVERLQGQERDYIFYSLANPNPIEDTANITEKPAIEDMERLAFFYSANRLNVALTRGRIKWIMMANQRVFDLAQELQNHESLSSEIRRGMASFASLRRIATLWQEVSLNNIDVWR